MPMIQAHSIRFGDAEWLLSCGKTLDHYCAKHSIPLTLWDDTERGYPAIKFCIIDMLKSFLESKDEWFLYVDADVLVHPEAPLIPTNTPGVHLATDRWHACHLPHWWWWCEHNYGVAPDRIKSNYYNAGVILCDRNAARMILDEALPPYNEFFQDQHSVNMWVEMARKKGLVVNQLNDTWNMWAMREEPAWFQHVWGESKMEILQKITPQQ